MTEPFFLSCEALSATTWCFVFCLCLYTSLSPSLSLPRSLVHSFMPAGMHSLNKHFEMPCEPDPLLGDPGSTEFHQNQQPPPLLRLLCFLPSFLAKLIHRDLLTACPGWPWWSLGLQSLSTLSNLGLLVLTLLAFRQPSTWSAATSFMHFWFPSTFCLLDMNGPFFLSWCLYK